MILGCIGDDFTGSSDLANTLAKAGMRTVQYSGVPEGDAGENVEAGVIALKSRTIAAAEAVALSLEALAWLKAQSCRQFYFKYCSTFDSTDEGNIGPVAEALADALGAETVIVCPAFPATGRTLFQGHLFVGDRLLSESGMENHPLTPMRDADIRRVLARQSKSTVGHVPYALVAKGAGAIVEELARQKAKGNRLVVVDAVRDEDLLTLGAAAAGLPLVTGGSGAAMGLPANFAAGGLTRGNRPTWRGASGPALALAGSVSLATRRQVEHHRTAGEPLWELNADDVVARRVGAETLVAWLLDQKGTPLIYSSTDPQTVAVAQERYGKEVVSAAIEGLFAETAALAVARGVRRLVSAGGETSGAIVTRLGVAALEIGPEIDPGVPAMKTSKPEIALALKSGNFGADDFFAKAARMLGEGQ
jgi:3-dehydrotetronate 4-kinase